MNTFTTKRVHISAIRVGDTVVHEGILQTVCAKNIKSGFCGITLFGDSYRSGTQLVEKAILGLTPSSGS